MPIFFWNANLLSKKYITIVVLLLIFYNSYSQKSQSIKTGAILLLLITASCFSKKC